MHSPFHGALEQVRKGNAPHRQASGVCLSEQPHAYPILAGIHSHGLLCSALPTPKAPSDVKGTGVSSLACPWGWDRVLERRPSKATDNLRTKRRKATQMENWGSSVDQGSGKFVCLSLLTHKGSALLSFGESALFQGDVLIPALRGFLRVTHHSSPF